MNKLTPYEKALTEKLQDLPVPDENAAWQEMKKLLDEDDDRRPFLPPVFRGCLPWLLGALLIAGGIFWLVMSGKNGPEPVVANQIRNADSSRNSEVASPKNNHSVPGISSSTEQHLQYDSVANAPATVNAQHNVTETSSNNTATGKERAGNHSVSGKNNPAERSLAQSSTKTGRRTFKQQGRTRMAVRRGAAASEGDDQVAINRSNKINNFSSGRTTTNNKSVKPANTEPIAQADLVTDTLTEMPDPAGARSGVDSTAKDTTAEVAVPISDTTINLPDSTSKKKKRHTPFTFAAGLAVNQTIPLNGEKLVPYDNLGRKGSLGDYIPSIYFRALRPKWFIQSEFRYGAPNSVKEFVYSSKTSIDTFQNSATSLKTLKKTFYHQLPVTFNYFVVKNWSVGVGVAYNKFTSAVRQEDVRLRIPGTVIDTLLSSGIVQNGRDSAFVSNTFQWIAETQFRWKRFSLGLRYAQGLQPYIKYTDPATGLPAEKRNQSFNAFLRYDLWRSKKK